MRKIRIVCFEQDSEWEIEISDETFSKIEMEANELKLSVEEVTNRILIDGIFGILITIGIEDKSKITVTLFQEKLLSIETETWIASGYKDAEGLPAYLPAYHLYSRDKIQFHGNLSALKELARKIYEVVGLKRKQTTQTFEPGYFLDEE